MKDDSFTAPQSHLPEYHALRIQEEIKQLGAMAYNRRLPETHYLPRVIQRDEHVRGIVYGRYKRGPTEKGRGVLVATDYRVIFLDKKPLFTEENDISYDMVGGVSYVRAGPAGTVTLTTRAGDYRIRTFNRKCAQNFVRYVSDKHLQSR